MEQTAANFVDALRAAPKGSLPLVVPVAGEDFPEAVLCSRSQARALSTALADGSYDGPVGQPEWIERLGRVVAAQDDTIAYPLALIPASTDAQAWLFKALSPYAKPAGATAA